MNDRIARNMWWTLALVAPIAAGSGACAMAPEPRAPAASTDVSMDLVEPEAAKCVPVKDRPAPGMACVREIEDQGVILVRFSATPRDAPCETLDIVFRMRAGMMVGEPGGQVELTWTAERAMKDRAEPSFLVGSPAVAMPTQLDRRGSRVEVSTRVPVAAVLSYGGEPRPTFEVTGRRIELSKVQAVYLRGFLRRIPFYGAVEPNQSLRDQAEEARHTEAAPPPRLVEARRRVDTRVERGERARRESARGETSMVDRSDTGWFCFDAASDDGSGKRTGSCYRTADECEAWRGGTQAVGRAAGKCKPSAAAECYDWRVGPRTGRSCFHRPAQCQRDEASRRAKEGAALHSQGCYRTE